MRRAGDVWLVVRERVPQNSPSAELHEVRGPNAFEPAFEAMAKGRVQAVLLVTDVIFSAHGGLIVELASKSRLPAIYPFREFVEAGGLMYYGAPLTAMYRRAGIYVDKILKGGRPEDLPVEQPTKFDLIINLKTAEALGMTIPTSVMIQATNVIK